MADTLQALYSTHRSKIDEAVGAIHNRSFYAHWPEVPSGKIYGETAMSDGEAHFKALLGQPFEALDQDENNTWYGSEESPYGFPLNVTYPVVSPDLLVERAERAFRPWAALPPDARAGVLMETLSRCAEQFFPIAFATMHTTGQGFMMAFQASGPHAFDRALEALALGWYEQRRYPERATWEKPIGKATVKLDKSYRPVGKGISLTIGCSTFPVWNSLPAVFASLVTGNPVIVKPHPKAILPMAMIVAGIRTVLRESGLDPNIVQLGVDSESLIAKDLAEHRSVKLIDYTGGSSFGDYLEGLRDKIVFTEKAGVNSVILDSVDALDPVLDNLAFSVSLYSGQMCTTPQNIFISQDGVMEGETLVPYQEVVQRLTEKITALAGNEKMGPGTLGAIQNAATLTRMNDARNLECTVKLDSGAIAQPGFEGARSVSPLVLEVAAQKSDVYSKEMFGPITLVIPTENTEESIEIAASLARDAGAITFAAYSTDEDTMRQIEEELAFAGTAISFNLTGPIWVNQSATFSDFHVTGGNPAGNASLVDSAFVTRRFYTVGVRKPAKDS